MVSNKKVRMEEIDVKINVLNSELEGINKTIVLNNINKFLNCFDLLKNRSRIYEINTIKKNLLDTKKNIDTNQDQNKYILDTFEIINKYMELDESESNLLSGEKDNNLLIENIYCQKKLLEDSYYKIIDPNHNYTPHKCYNYLYNNYLYFLYN